MEPTLHLPSFVATDSVTGLSRFQWVPCDRNWKVRLATWRVRWKNWANDSCILRRHRRIAASILTRCSGLSSPKDIHQTKTAPLKPFNIPTTGSSTCGTTPVPPPSSTIDRELFQLPRCVGQAISAHLATFNPAASALRYQGLVRLAALTLRLLVGTSNHLLSSLGSCAICQHMMTLNSRLLCSTDILFV